MKRKAIFGCALLLVLILFFPVASTREIAGQGHLLGENREGIGVCSLSVEIKEVKSLAVKYSKRFAFTLDGRDFSRFGTHVHRETSDGRCLISQMYYDGETNRYQLCTVFYAEDLSWLELTWAENCYALRQEPPR